jgi:predicted DNA-binding transcriptional regulator AlpA
MTNTSNPSAKSSISPLLHLDKVAELLGCSERTVRNMHREGRMPPRVVVSERIIGWRESDIEAWLTSRREEGGGVMRWLFMWQDEDLNMSYEIYSCQTQFEARERFEHDHPGTFAFAVISGGDFGVEEFHA